MHHTLLLLYCCWYRLLISIVYQNSPQLLYEITIFAPKIVCSHIGLFCCDLCCLMSREQLHYRSHNMCKFLSIFDLSDILLSRHYTMHHIFMLSNFLLHDLIFNTIDHVPETWMLMFRFLWSNEILWFWYLIGILHSTLDRIIRFYTIIIKLFILWLCEQFNVNHFYLIFLGYWHIERNI